MANKILDLIKKYGKIIYGKSMDIFEDSPVFFAYKSKDAIIIKIKGNANYLHAPEFDKFLKSTLNNYKRYCIMFDECTALDSTCLGILAGLLLNLKKVDGVCFFCGLKPRQFECIKIVGLDKLAHIINKISLESSMEELDEINDNNKIGLTLQLVLEAHRFLLEINARNNINFKDVVSLLEEKNF